MSTERHTLVTSGVSRDAVAPLRLLAEQAFSRPAGAPLVQENRIRILKDARENYPAWLDAIGAAKSTVHFESYIIPAADIGHRFADLMCAKAREGVRVRLIYDWFGARGASSWRFWRRMRQSGIEVRCFNPPRLDSPLGWLSRDHRETTVDGRIGFVYRALCRAESWFGDADGVEPWRDTGVVIEGPAVFDLEQAFAVMWAGLGASVPIEDLVPESAAIPPAGAVALRIVPTLPGRARSLPCGRARRPWPAAIRLDCLAHPDYVEALAPPPRDGVECRSFFRGPAIFLWCAPCHASGIGPARGRGPRL